MTQRRVLIVIPARGGSKGIPKKNITPLAGLPLIAWSLRAAIKAKLNSTVVVSTDSEEIAEVARQFGALVPGLRPPELASDTAKSFDAIAHTVRVMKEAGETFDDVILIQPTSPFLQIKHIEEAFQTYLDGGCKGLVSVSPSKDHPVLLRTMVDGTLTPILEGGSTRRRQEFSTVYKVNGALYINPIEDYEKPFVSLNDNPHAYVMDALYGLDIDEPIDLMVAQALQKELAL